MESPVSRVTTSSPTRNSTTPSRTMQNSSPGCVTSGAVFAPAGRSRRKRLHALLADAGRELAPGVGTRTIVRCRVRVGPAHDAKRFRPRAIPEVGEELRGCKLEHGGDLEKVADGASDLPALQPRQKRHRQADLAGERIERHAPLLARRPDRLADVEQAFALPALPCGGDAAHAGLSRIVEAAVWLMPICLSSNIFCLLRQSTPGAHRRLDRSTR